MNRFRKYATFYTNIHHTETLTSEILNLNTKKRKLVYMSENVFKGSESNKESFSQNQNCSKLTDNMEAKTP